MKRYIKISPVIKNANWFFAVFYFLFAIFFITIHIRLRQYAYDDAYIHFRIARNLFETGAPYYNINDMLKVSTSSGWTVFLAILYAVANLFKAENNFSLIISMINALISMCAVYVYTKISGILLVNPLSISKRFVFQISLIAFLLPASIGLMETPFALLLAGLGIYFLLLSKPSGFTLLAVAAYIRLELLILLALAGLFVFIRKQLKAHQIAGYSLLGFAPFVLYDIYFFHTILPHSIVAKSLIYSLTSTDTLYMMINSLLGSFLSSSSQNLFWVALKSITFFSVLIFTGWAALTKRKTSGEIGSALFFFWGVGVLCMYLLRHALLFDWYVPLYMIPIFVSCFVYSSLIPFPRNFGVKASIVVLFCLSALLIAADFYSSFYNFGAYSNFQGGSHLKSYLAIGEILNEEYPNATLMAPEIGGLGYAFKGKILDAAGLASPEALPFYQKRDAQFPGSFPPEYVKAAMPDIIVSYDGAAKALLNNQVVDQYNVIAIPAYLPEDEMYSEDKILWGDKYVRIYLLKTLPISPKIYGMTQKTK